jgi:hypothetical protein
LIGTEKDEAAAIPRTIHAVRCTNEADLMYEESEGAAPTEGHQTP